jgi:hypothetical protein
MMSFYGQYTGFGGGVSGNQSLFDVLTALSLTTNLEVCLDAGDSTSYSSGQSWLDRSGNGFDFFLGATDSVASDDPTFNGTAGGLSSEEYFSFDGGDFFRYDGTNETWMNNLHKNSAKFSIASWVRTPNAGSHQRFIGTNAGADTNIGVHFQIQSNEVVSIYITAGGGATAMSFASDDAVSVDTWHFLGVSVDEATGAGGGFLYLDGAYLQVGSADTFDATYTSPTTSDATYTMEIGAGGNAAGAVVNTFRIALVAMWEGSVITSANFDSIYAQTRGRFGR